MKRRVLLIVALFAIILTGCGQSEDKKEAETMTVKDAKGEVEIPKDPKRIVDISGNSDILSILGYKVVGTANSDAYDYTKFPTYLDDTLNGATILGYSMQDTMDIEGIIALNPDLIIISNVQEKMYKQLSEIAPTVMLEMAQMSWRDDVYSVASIFDKKEKADTWLKEYDKVAKKEGETIRSSYGEDATYLSFLASGGQLFLFEGAGIGNVMYDDLGLKKPENMPAQENISLPVVTYEGLAQIDPDYIFVVGTDDDLQALEDSTLWQSMRAVKEKNYVTLPASPYFNIGYSCIGRLQFLEEVGTYMKDMHE